RALDGDMIIPNVETHGDVMQRQRMAKRNQTGRQFRGLDARDARHRERIPLRERLFFESRDGFRLANDPAGGERPANLLGFVAHVDHPRAARWVQMGKLAHCSSLPKSRASASPLSGSGRMRRSAFAKASAVTSEES